ncbi:TPA: hypothetical protein DDW35_08870 [Candidatus Sumerlaeota bacterium]|nr:hypothetical protein [Candidatus Sumerlaeota bacterium]
MEFKSDEAAAWIMAQTFVAGKDFPCVGLVSSRGIENFPLFIYLLGIPSLFSFWPVASVAFIAVLDSLMLFPLYTATRRLWNNPTANITCLLYALSPAAIFFSRKIWAQDLMPVFGIGLFYLMERLTAPGDNPATKRGIPFLFGLLCATAPQVHLSGLFLIIASVPILAFFQRTRNNLLWIIIGLTAGLIFSLPWWGCQLHNPAAFLAKLHHAVPRQTALQPLKTALFFLQQTTDAGFSWSLEKVYFPFLCMNPGYIPLIYTLLATGAIGIIFCLGQGIYTWKDRNARRKLTITLCFPIIAVGGLLFSHTPIYPHYFSAFYPYPFLFAALTLGTLFQGIQRLPIPWRRAFYFCFMFALCAMAFLQIAYVLRFIEILNKYGGIDADYGTTYARQMQRVENGLPAECRKSPRQAYLYTIQSVVRRAYGLSEAEQAPQQVALFEEIISDKAGTASKVK